MTNENTELKTTEKETKTTNKDRLMINVRPTSPGMAEEINTLFKQDPNLAVFSGEVVPRGGVEFLIQSRDTEGIQKLFPPILGYFDRKLNKAESVFLAKTLTDNQLLVLPQRLFLNMAPDGLKELAARYRDLAKEHPIMYKSGMYYDENKERRPLILEMPTMQTLHIIDHNLSKYSDKNGLNEERKRQGKFTLDELAEDGMISIDDLAAYLGTTVLYLRKPKNTSENRLVNLLPDPTVVRNKRAITWYFPLDEVKKAVKECYTEADTTTKVHELPGTGLYSIRQLSDMVGDNILNLRYAKRTGKLAYYQLGTPSGSLDRFTLDDYEDYKEAKDQMIIKGPRDGVRLRQALTSEDDLSQYMNLQQIANMFHHTTWKGIDNTRLPINLSIEPTLTYLRSRVPAYTYKRKTYLKKEDIESAMAHQYGYDVPGKNGEMVNLDFHLPKDEYFLSRQGLAEYLAAHGYPEANVMAGRREFYRYLDYAIDNEKLPYLHRTQAENGTNMSLFLLSDLLKNPYLEKQMKFSQNLEPNEN